jgi:hypothetical protein
MDARLRDGHPLFGPTLIVFGGFVCLQRQFVSPYVFPQLLFSHVVSSMVRLAQADLLVSDSRVVGRG